MYPFVRVFDRDIPSYGLMMLLAAAAAWLLLIVLAKKKREENAEGAALRLPPKGLRPSGRPSALRALKTTHAGSSLLGDISSVFLLALCGGIVGAFTLRPLMRLAELALAWENYDIASAEDLLRHIGGEAVFFGGLLGGMGAIILVCRKNKTPILPVFDIFAPALALGHAIGRVGCHLAGCCYGIEMRHHPAFSVIYPASSLGAPSGVPLLPVPLLEAAFLLALSIALIALYLRGNTPGMCVSAYIIAYSAWRFVIEFFRGDALRGVYGPLSTAQIISMGLLFLVTVSIIRHKHLREDHP